MTTPFKTDAGVFRKALEHLKMPGYNTGRVYNDLNKKTNTRRLKIEHPSYHNKKPTKRQLEDLENIFKAEYGGRFKSIKHLPGTPAYWGVVGAGLAVYLDDNVAPAPKRPRKPVPETFANARRGVTRDQHFDIWFHALKLKKRGEKQSQLTSGKLNLGVIATTTVDLTVYKKVYAAHTGQHLVAEMVIPAGTRVRAAYGKCRAAKAVVKSIFSRSTGKEHKEAWSGHDCCFKYEVGKTVKPKNGFADWNDECAGGIHFFIDFDKAKAY
jgi:hypothetical protein